ncbi:VOC family protein [Aquabacterium sp.]|uniref:VOC family protein n=1 Tax=Aquabacterium sp. TaxID=1872578 RepID=UPI002B9F3565|nr:VOC family protein [Aquabacterium sp.]HSW02996.1 VOC family protein [Aquabacterium sp.]
MQLLPGKFVWFEHQSPDVAAARRFYDELFGWHTEMMPMGEQRYPLIMNGSAGIGGFTALAAGSASPQWRSYLSVADVDASYRLAIVAGAKSLQGPTDFGEVGRGAVIQDPTGAAVALWTSSQGDHPDVPQAPVGNFCWTELSTPDARRALAFYEQVFGYGHQTETMPQGQYHLLTKDGQQRGGLMQCPDAKAPAKWLPYVAVASAEDTLAKAESLGARSLMSLHDVPHVGRMGMLTDPQGASIAFIQLLPLAA